jgi:hypothetical protein
MTLAECTDRTRPLQGDGFAWRTRIDFRFFTEDALAVPHERYVIDY